MITSPPRAGTTLLKPTAARYAPHIRRHWKSGRGIGGAQAVEERARAQRQVEPEEHEAQHQRPPVHGRQVGEELPGGFQERADALADRGGRGAARAPLKRTARRRAPGQAVRYNGCMARAQATVTRPHRGGDRPDRRDRPGGRGRAGALTRGRLDPRHGAPAVRPARTGLEEGLLQARRRARPRRGAALVRRGRRGRAPGVHDHGRRKREPGGQSRRLAQRVRGERSRRAPSGSCTPPRWPRTAFIATTLSRSPRRSPRGAPPPTTTRPRRPRSRRC